MGRLHRAVDSIVRGPVWLLLVMFLFPNLASLVLSCQIVGLGCASYHLAAFSQGTARPDSVTLSGKRAVFGS